MTQPIDLLENATPLDTVEGAQLCAERLHNDFRLTGTPVKLRGGIGARWGWDALKEAFAGVTLPVSVSPSGAFLHGNRADEDPLYDPGDPRISVDHGRYYNRTMGFAELVARMAAPSDFRPLVAQGERLYWYGHSMPAALRERLAPHSCLRDYTSPALWCSQAGSVTTLHYDSVPSVLTQVIGDKEVLCVDARADMSEYPFLDPRARQSTILDVRAVDATQHPAACSARRWKTTIRPGESLLIPEFVWHYVESRTNSVSVSLRDETSDHANLITDLIGMIAGGSFLDAPAFMRQCVIAKLQACSASAPAG